MVLYRKKIIGFWNAESKCVWLQKTGTELEYMLNLNTPHLKIFNNYWKHLFVFLIVPATATENILFIVFLQQ